MGSIFGSGRSPGERNGYSRQYSCLENPIDRGAWGVTVHGVTKSQTQLNDLHFHMVLVLFSRCLCVTTKSESEVPQLYPTLCNPMDYSLPGSSVHGIFQAKILEWVTISFSRGIFPTQGSNLRLLHCRWILYH